jgi:hypothetical protein
MSNEEQILIQFKKQLISFFDELISQFPNEPCFVMLRILFNDQAPIKEVMNKFVHKLVSTRDMIKNRDENFFLSQTQSFLSFLDKDTSQTLKRLWRSDTLDTDDKDTIWRWIDSLVFLADKHSKFLSELR